MWEMLDSWADSETHKFGLRWLARWALSLWWARLMRGVRLYSNPAEMAADRSWSEVMENAKTVDACFIRAHDALHSDAHLSKINRLLLPDPFATSTKSYANAMEDDDLLELIKNSTTNAKRKGIQVRWLKESIGYSFYIADRDYLDPYIHIEFAIPGMRIIDRPSITIKKKTHPKIFREFAETYDQLWDRFSRAPDNGAR